MAGRLSFSDSLHSSWILSLRGEASIMKETNEKPSFKRREITIGQQIALCAAFFGSQTAAEFQSIFGVLSLQYFGLPVYLVTMDGVIGGLFGIFFIPFLGAFSDRGSNPKVRKALIQIATLVILASAYVIIIICSLFKVRSEELEDVIIYTRENGSNIVGEFWEPQFDYSNNMTRHETTRNTSGPPVTPRSAPETGIPAMAILAVVAFIFIDIGFDMSLSLPRGMIADCVPEQQKTRVLATGTSLSSLGGVVMGVLGVLDLPVFLGAEFHTDGMAATLILLSSCFLLIAVVTFTSTVVTAMVLASRNTRECLETAPLLGNKEDIVCYGLGAEEEQEESKRNYRNKYYSDGNRKLVGKEEGFSVLSVAANIGEKGNARNDKEHSTGCDNAPDVDSTSFLQAMGVDNVWLDGEQNYNPDKQNSGHEKAPTNFHDAGDQQNEEDKKSPSTKITTFKGYPRNKHFVLTLLVAFTNFGGVVCCAMYASNTLNLEVMHGDPLAPPGTMERKLYEEGIRLASFGSLLFGLGYCLTSFANRKLMEKMDCAAILAMGSAMQAAAGVVFYLVPSPTTYLVMMAVFGMYKCFAHIFPFVLGLKYSNFKSPTVEEEGELTNTGRVTTLVGSLFPLHFFIISCFMGPVMDATGNAWIPIWYMIAMASFNGFVSALLLII